MVNKSNNIRIAKNTIFLYFRMALIMLVTLYTSRVTLKILGVDDYGIYQTVGGVVTFLSFLSSALGSGTSRFIVFEMGKEKPKTAELFSTVRIAHIVLGIIIVVLGEIIGLWFIYNKLIIPEPRFSAAVFAFHFSMLATFFQITQVPYNAIIIAYEKMNVYAYVSIIEAILKLIIVYLLQLFIFDKLEVYAVLMCAVTIVVMLIYRVYCRYCFSETKLKLMFNKEMFSGVASFSGWNLLTSSSAALANQGVTVVTNMFFPTAIVTVRTLALRINNIINGFIGNFRTAVNPQIIKKYASGELIEARKLALSSTKYTFYLMYVIVLPLLLLVEPALKIWLDEVPEGLIPFVRLTLIQGLFQTIDTSLYVPIYAKGRIKENTIISPIFDFIQLPIIFILFKKGFPAITIAWVQTLAYFVLGVIVKPLLVHFIVEYRLKDIYIMLGNCLVITVLSSIIPVILYRFIDVNTFGGFISLGVVCIANIAAFVWILGIDKDTKNIIVSLLKNKLITK